MRGKRTIVVRRVFLTIVAYSGSQIIGGRWPSCSILDAFTSASETDTVVKGSRYPSTVDTIFPAAGGKDADIRGGVAADEAEE